jgi:hypothetical protein
MVVGSSDYASEILLQCSDVINLNWHATLVGKKICFL